MSQGRSSYLSEPEANEPTTRIVHPSASETSRRFPDRLADDPPLVFGNVPPRNPNFTGRDELLDQLTKRLSSGTTAVLPSALHGLGGIGKTQMAAEYIYRHLQDYDLVWWIDAAESPDTVLPFFPRNGPGEILITSRNSDWAGIARPLELAVFKREESVELLGRRGPEIDPADAEELAEKLGAAPHGRSPHWTRTTPNPAEWPGKRWSAPLSNLARLVKSLIARKGEPVAGRGSRNHLIVVADVEGFGERWRTGPDQRAVRDGLYGVMEAAFAATGTAWKDCYREDRGDGLLVLVPRDVDKAAFIEAALPVLVTRLRVHNHTHPEAQRIRLRIALHAGEVGYDEHGVSSSSVTLTFRLCEAPPLKAALAASPGVLVAIASHWLFDDVVRHAPGAAPATWCPVWVEVKETATTGWVTRPDHPYQAAPDTGSIGQPDSA
ncbi:hypothetical protein [Amycolatopsis sp. WAC 01376]|uniref:hypothetical protein n=1 Tax=Amycolatopsis sp. WAC 01376 TaxID=2203195 RepID=UPI001F158FBD|nr:hypothetical protein [Amycolatopsis sp. WAC 01376]